jgi:hypothetical protein
VNRLPRSRGVPRWVSLVLVASLLAPSLVAAQAALEATFADLKGEVEWSPAGSSQFQAASLNTVLHAGDRIRTAANSAARLAYFEGSATQLGDATEVRIDTLQQGADQNLVRLTQASGTSQGAVQQRPGVATSYQTETPVSVTEAPPMTCPWVRVDADGTTLVRNYQGAQPRGSITLDVPQLSYTTTFVPGPFGPVPQLVPQPTTTSMTVPAGSPMNLQALSDCPFGDQAGDVPGVGAVASAESARVANTGTSSPARLLQLSADSGSAAAPLSGADSGPSSARGAAVTDPALAARPVAQAQGGGRNLRVRNTAGDRIETVTVAPGEETRVRPGLPPDRPLPIGQIQASERESSLVAALSLLQQQMQQRDAQRELLQGVAGNQLGQALSTLQINQIELQRLVAQEQALLAQIAAQQADVARREQQISQAEFLLFQQTLSVLQSLTQLQSAEMAVATSIVQIAQLETQLEQQAQSGSPPSPQQQAQLQQQLIQLDQGIARLQQQLIALQPLVNNLVVSCQQIGAQLAQLPPELQAIRNRLDQASQQLGNIFQVETTVARTLVTLGQSAAGSPQALSARLQLA